MGQLTPIGETIGDWRTEENVQLDCKIHGAYTGWRFYINNRLIHASKCPQCEPEYYKQQTEQPKTPEKWGMGISNEHQNCTFANFGTTTTEQKQALNCCINFVEKEFPQKLILLGRTGTGKTHLATAMLKANKHGKIISFNELIREIKSGENYHKTAQYMIFDYSNTPFLAIDELGGKNITPTDREILFEIVDKRHSCNMQTVYISNLDAKQFKNWCDDDRITDRLFQHSIFVKLEWQSYRKKTVEGKENV
jgi:DNA replication protein DnaC